MQSGGGGAQGAGANHGGKNNGNGQGNGNLALVSALYYENYAYAPSSIHSLPAHVHNEDQGVKNIFQN